MLGKKKVLLGGLSALVVGSLLAGCPPKKEALKTSAVGTDAASKVYVPPGKHDEFYVFFSGGFNGQVTVYGIPSGRILKVIKVFSVDPETGYGFTPETRPMFMTSHGFIPWDDTHHPWLSQTNGEHDGRWLFINANSTPRIARIDLTTFETTEIIEIPNSAGNHPSPYGTENTEYVVAGTRFSVPVPQKDVPIDSYAQNFKGTISFIKANEPGKMDVAFQILMPGFNYDLARCGRGPSHGWCFFTSYNTEQAHTLLEINASKNDKDYIAAINWKRAEECLSQGRFQEVPAVYYHNYYDEKKHTAVSEVKKSVKMINPKDCPGVAYLLPTPKSPHGVDVSDDGEYIVGGGKLATVIPIHSFSKMLKAIEQKAFEKEIDGVPVLKYDAVLHCEVEKPCLGPLHTEFDGKGFAYTSCFVSSEVVKYDYKGCKVVDRVPTYYSVGHLLIPGGDTKKPYGKYLVAMNKITKDRQLPVGPELLQSAQLYDISGEKMQLIHEFFTIGEPHYAQAIPADKIKDKIKKIYPLAENEHPYAVKAEKDARVERKGNEVHVYMTMIRSHFVPDNIEGIRVGDTVYFHVTNLEQDWDIPHGFAVKGSEEAEILVMPGQTKTLVWKPKAPGVYPFYCTDFCSALHQEMQGYVRVSPAGSNVPLRYYTGTPTTQK